MIEYYSDMINRQNESSFIQWIFVEYLTHDSAYFDASDCAVNTAYKSLSQRTTEGEFWQYKTD